MPDFPLTVTVSTRVANLVRDAAARETGGAGGPGPPSARDYFTGEVRRLAVNIARTEKRRQGDDAEVADLQVIDDEVTAV